MDLVDLMTSVSVQLKERRHNVVTRYPAITGCGRGG